MKNFAAFSFALFMILSHWDLLAQETVVHRYINLNDALRSKVYEVPDETLDLEYHDYIGQWKELPVIIKDWKNKVVAQLKLEKSFGQNHFAIKLDGYASAWELNKLYSVEIYAEQNKKFEFQMRLIPKPVKAAPSIDIFINPVQFDCSLLAPKLVEYYGVVAGGRAPYTVQWYILNEAKNDFLYQPRQERMNAGKTMTVQVDKAPAYYVVLYVTDACGAVEKKTVFISCDDSKKKINTIFVEPLQKTLIDQINTTN